MAHITTRYEILVVGHYTSDEIEATSSAQAEEEAITEFYDNAHRTSIYDTRVEDWWLVCEECNEERVDEDHECEDSENEKLSDDY